MRREFLGGLTPKGPPSNGCAFWDRALAGQASRRYVEPVQKLAPYTHVIFDLDGVLLDSEPLYTQATEEIVAEYGKTYPWALKSQMMGRAAHESAQTLIEALELPLTPEQFIARKLPILERLFAHTPEMRGAPEFVAKLFQRRVPMAVATSSNRKLFEQKTQAHAWFSSFQAVVCGDDPRIEALKPSPDIFLVAARELGAEPTRCVVFEDSLAGVEAALSAGMQVIALPDPRMDRNKYARCARVIASYSELVLETPEA